MSKGGKKQNTGYSVSRKKKKNVKERKTTIWRVIHSARESICTDKKKKKKEAIFGNIGLIIFLSGLANLRFICAEAV